jgi:2,4-dienoyl-CoA reductase-like NADH-dependent reductase (Old Yellow Enzyme family)
MPQLFKARLYGFDGIQIHAAYANLLAQFMECLDNRLWVIEEIYKRIR